MHLSQFICRKTGIEAHHRHTKKNTAMPRRILALLPQKYPVGDVWATCRNPKVHPESHCHLFEVIGHTSRCIRLRERHFKHYTASHLNDLNVGDYWKNKLVVRAYRFAASTVMKIHGAILVPFKDGKSMHCKHRPCHSTPECYESLGEMITKMKRMCRHLCYMHVILGCDTPILEAIFESHALWV